MWTNALHWKFTRNENWRSDIRWLTHAGRWCRLIVIRCFFIYGSFEENMRKTRLKKTTYYTEVVEHYSLRFDDWCINECDAVRIQMRKKGFFFLFLRMFEWDIDVNSIFAVNICNTLETHIFSFYCRHDENVREQKKEQQDFLFPQYLNKKRSKRILTFNRTT